MVIELNPFETSGAGHLFSFGKDLKVLLEGPFEARVRDITPIDLFEDIPVEWQDILRSSGDVYGIDEKDFKPNLKHTKTNESLNEESYVLLVASGSPIFDKDINERESRDWVQRAYDIFLKVYQIPSENIIVLTFREEDCPLYLNAKVASAENFIAAVNEI